MKLLYISIAVLLLAALPACTQPENEFAVPAIATYGQFIGSTEAEIEAQFGKPDESGVEAEVWTYLIRSGDNTVAGYRQFGMWGGKVAGVLVRRYTSEARATKMQEEAVGAMGKKGNTVMKIAQGSPLLSDALLMAKKADNFWYTDLVRENAGAYVTVIVVDVEYNHLLMAAEAARVSAKHGL